MQDAVSSTIHKKENEQFLDLFRYRIVTSNLLREHVAVGGARGHSIHVQEVDLLSSKPDHKAWSIEGVWVVVAATGVVSWMLKWSLLANSIWTGISKFLLVTVVVFIARELILAHARRQRLQYLRQEAIKTVNDAVTNFDAFDKSSAASITLIQEVEAVSRGYHLNGAVPPITILEERTPTARTRRCLRLRHQIQSAYSELIPDIIQKCETLKLLVNADDFERQLEVHEVADPDIQEAFSGATISEIEDQESLRALRTMHLRFSILRRVFLCYLLSLSANGNRTDIYPWKTTLEAMKSLAVTTGQLAEQLNDLLREDEHHHPIPSTPTAQRTSPEKERFRAHLRKTNELASELRTMQTKLLILRDDVSRLLEAPPSTVAPGAPPTLSLSTFTIPALFLAQADSIATDLKSLNHSFDSWRTSLQPHDHNRRTSWTSSGLRSPISLGGLTLISEHSLGGPSDALRALSGQSSASGGSPAASSNLSDEEVFEAIAVPRVRKVFTREEKMAKLLEDETRRASAKEQRMQSGNMMRELESVMSKRSSKRMSTGRILVPANRMSSI